VIPDSFQLAVFLSNIGASPEIRHNLGMKSELADLIDNSVHVPPLMQTAIDMLWRLKRVKEIIILFKDIGHVYSGLWGADYFCECLGDRSGKF
jgi:hypothetical protein